MNSVTSLLETPFLTRDPTQQLHIIGLNRPLPSLKLASLEIVDGNTIVHSFNAEIYQMNDWICGCEDSNAFFCFPCVLFGGEDNWSTLGYNNIIHLGDAIAKHELNAVHMTNMLRYSSLKRTPKTSETKVKNSIEEENRRIGKNLQILDAIIDCIKFCACGSIAMSKQPDEDEDVEGDEVDPFKELLIFMTSSNTSLRHYLQQPPFHDMESMKSDILKAASEVIREEIIKEIQQAQFVSMIVENGDSDYPRIITLRYVKGCEPVERIWKIIHYEDMNRFIDTLLTELRTHLKKPLISQSYDQINLKRQDSSFKLFVKVLSYFPQANLVHFYRHDFLDIISSVASIEKFYQNFWCMVWGISAFMTEEPWGTKIRTTFETVRKRFYKDTQRKEIYDFSSMRLESVYHYRRALLETMNTILENFQGYPDHVLSQASSYKSMLEDEMNIYMLENFFEMIPFYNQCINEYEHCMHPTYYSDPDIIRSILDGNTSEILTQQSQLNSRTQEVEVKVENDLEIHDIDLSQVKTEVEESPQQEEFSCLPGTSKRKHDEEGEALDGKKKEKVVKIVESVMIQLEELLKYRTNMFASQLVDPRNFSQFSLNFPDHFVTTVVVDLHFFNAFESMKLRTELGVLYAQEEYQSLKSSCDVLREILDNNLTSTFPETVKLLNMVLTFPSKTDDPRRCFRTNDKVRQFLKESLWFKNIDCLIYFRCERTFVENIEEFKTKVIQKFLDGSDQATHFRRLTPDL